MALAARLRPDESFGEAWRVADWLVLAVDGSRIECPRTTANERGLKCAGKEKTNPQILQTTRQGLVDLFAGLPEFVSGILQKWDRQTRGGRANSKNWGDV